MDRLAAFFDGLDGKVASFSTYENMPDNFRRLSVILKLTNTCNSRCQYCQSWQDEQASYFPLEWIHSLIACLSSCYRSRVVISGGEPTLSPFLPTILQLLADNNIPVILITNGLTPNANNFLAKKFDELIFSIDTINPSIYRQIRGIDGLNIVLRNLSNAIGQTKFNNSPLVSVNIVLSKPVLKDLDNTIQYLVNVGVRRFYFLPLETHLEMNGLLVPKPEDWNFFFSNIHNRVIEILRDVGVFLPWWSFFSGQTLSSGTTSLCIVPWLQAVIRSNGDVYPCCRLGDDGTEQSRDSRFLLGSLAEEPFDSIVWGEHAQTVRRTIAKIKPHPCENCDIGAICSVGAITGATLPRNIPGATCSLNYSEYIKV